MPSNISESDFYETNVVGPDDGDAANATSVRNGLQDLANRSTFLKNRFDSYAQYTASGTGIADTGTLTLAEDFEQGGYTLSSDEVEVPIAGKYLVTFTVQLASTDTANPKQFFLSLTKGAVDQVVPIAWRPTATAGDPVTLHLSLIVTVTTPASEKLKLINYSGTGTVTVTAANAKLQIRRIS